MASAIDLVRASNGQMPASTEGSAEQTFLDECADMGAERLERFELYREFYEGDHRVELTDRAREYLERKGVRFSENFCEPIVDMIAERLTVTGYDVMIGEEEEGDATEAIATWLKREFWRANRLDETAGVVHSIALSRGESFGIIGYDNAKGRPTFAFNAPERMKACYCDDDPERMEYAVKTWDTDEAGPSSPDGRRITRMNLYYPDRIERYFKLHASQGRGGWSRWMDAPDPDSAEPAPWPTPWVDAAGEPLGIPVVHFRNRAQGRPHGRSELVGVVPQNMLLNKQVLDLAMVIDNQGWPQRWVSGVDPTTAGFKTAPGEMWVTSSKDARFGQFDSADIAPMLAGIDSTLGRMARRSGMPLHMLMGGDVPSGEAMKTAEARLVKRCEDRAVSFGNRWEDAGLMAIRLAALADDLPVPVDVEQVALDALWDSPESRDDKAEAETAAIWSALGASKRTLLARAGFDPDQEEARRAEESASAAQQAARFFDGGGDTTEPAPPAGQGGGPPENMPPA